MKPEILVQSSIAILEEAKTAVEAAETDLEKALAAMRKAPRADKVSVSTTIETALRNLRKARAQVVLAEKTLEGKSE